MHSLEQLRQTLLRAFTTTSILDVLNYARLDDPTIPADDPTVPFLSQLDNRQRTDLLNLPNSFITEGDNAWTNEFTFALAARSLHRRIVVLRYQHVEEEEEDAAPRVVTSHTLFGSNLGANSPTIFLSMMGITTSL